MSGILGGKKSQSNDVAAVGGFQLQTSAYGKVIPIAFGAVQIAPNIMWYGNFTAIPQASSGAGGKGGVGGGGGGKGGGGSTQYLYSVSVQFGLCEGPINGFGVVWKDKNITTIAGLGMSTFLGTYPQSPWGYLVGSEGISTLNSTVPGSPYKITVPNPQNFVADFGVSGTPSVAQFTRVYNFPINPGQYLITSSDYSGNITYQFNTADIGKKVIVRYYDGYSRLTQTTQVIPNVAFPQFSVYGQEGTPLDAGITATVIAYTPTAGAPAANQYNEADGVYTFNAANAGASVTINYSSVDASGGYAVLGYNGVAHADVANYQLGSSPQLSNHNFEVYGIGCGGVAGKLDADPSLVVTNLLTAPTYGVGFPSSKLGDLTNFQNYALASNLLISPLYDSQNACNSMLSDIATACNSEYVWSSGQLTLVPYGDASVTGNGHTYTPPSQPLYDLTNDDFITENQGSDPVQLDRKRVSDSLNRIQLECLDRSNQYNPSIVQAKNQAEIDYYGLRQNNATQAHLFCDTSIAMVSAQLQLQRQSVQNYYTFTVDQRYIGLDPMDIVTITDTRMGLDRQWVRIKEITENQDHTLTMMAEEYLAGTGTAAEYTFQESQGFIADYNSDPGNANTPVVFELPIQVNFTGGLEVDIACSGGSNWGGCDVWISFDNANYKLAGRVNGGARAGYLSADFPVGLNPDTTNVCSVDLSQCRGQLLGGTQSDADQFHTICWVGGEIISYETAELTDSYNFDLNTYMQRGGYGTTIIDHPMGTKFVRIDDGVFYYTYDKSKIGTQIYIKMLSFNIYGGGEQSLSDVSPFIYLITGPPLPAAPDTFSGEQSGNVVVFKWNDIPNDVGLKGYDIAYGPVGSTWEGKTLLTEAARGTEMTNAAVIPGTWDFSIRSHDIADNLSILANTFTLTVVNANEVIAEVEQAPAWPGALVNLVHHYTDVLTPEGTKTVDQYTQIAAPSAPVLSQISGGTNLLVTYYVIITYVDAGGETVASSETSLTVLLNSLLVVTSPPASGLATGYNVYVGTSSGAETLQNDIPVLIGVNWTQPPTGLVAGLSPPSQNTTGWQVFDVYVPDVCTSASYTAPTIDVGIDGNVRVYCNFTYGFGFEQSGVPGIGLQIDTWLTGQTDPNIYSDWTIGFINMRYLNARLNYPAIVQGEVAYFASFEPVVDNSPQIEQADSVAVAPGGTVITFPQPFHIIPNVVATPVGSTALYVSAASISTTHFTAHVWNAAGTDVGGLINWQAVGE